MAKALFRLILSIYVLLYRRTGGRIGGTMRGFPVLLLTTTGRKTGRKWTTPLGYFEYDGGYVVAGSYVALGGTYPAWFHNLTSHPQVTLHIQDRKLPALAERADPELRKLLWAKLMELAPGYGDYQRRTTREIPMVILRPISQT
jgi:deazaflavin-dependent oxidoreductase (nitroreductase family)